MQSLENYEITKEISFLPCVHFGKYYLLKPDKINKYFNAKFMCFIESVFCTIFPSSKVYG